MFTGIIEGQGLIEAVDAIEKGMRLRVRTSLDLSDVQPGDSIAVDGCCLTAVTCDTHSFVADVSHETLACTTLGVQAKPGSAVNLERALRLGDRMGGHWVQGHVDSVGHLQRRERVGDAENLYFELPADLAQTLVEKGSVTVDGVSLTVNGVGPDSFHVTMIPHTAAVTTLGAKNVGDPVNIETDIIGKYVANQLRNTDVGSLLTDRDK